MFDAIKSALTLLFLLTRLKKQTSIQDLYIEMCIKLKVSFLAIIWLLTLMYFIYQRVN